MAKKSAKSKGYRRQTVKKPYLSKRDIVTLCVVVAVLAVGAFFLFRYDDGALKVKDGAVVADGENWLIVDGSNVRGRSRYFKVGEMGDIDGYQREKTASSADVNMPEYVFTPEAEGTGIERATVTCAHNGAGKLAEYARIALDSMDGTEATELQTAELAGRNVTSYTYTVDAKQEEDAAEDAEEKPEEAAETAEETAEAKPEEAAEEAEAKAEESPRFTKALAGYFDAAHDSCFIIHVESHADNAEDCPSDEAMTAVLEQVVAAITPEEAK